MTRFKYDVSSVRVQRVNIRQKSDERAKFPSNERKKKKKREKQRETIVRRCDDDAQLLHDVERFPVDAARRVKLNCHERVGRRVYVLHLRQLARVRLRELRRP